MVEIAATGTAAEAAQATADRFIGTVRAMISPGLKPMPRLLAPARAGDQPQPCRLWLRLAGEQMLQSGEVMNNLTTSRQWSGSSSGHGGLQSSSA